MSCQAWSSSIVGQRAECVQMPALAVTMSSRPSWATPSSTAAFTSAGSPRTSAWVATMRRSSASTSVTVSAMSSGVDSSYGTVATWSHRSTAMMSAPSCGQPDRVRPALAPGRRR